MSTTDVVAYGTYVGESHGYASVAYPLLDIHIEGYRLGAHGECHVVPTLGQSSGIEGVCVVALS